MTALVLMSALFAFGIFDGVIINKFELIGAPSISWLVPIIAILAIPSYAMLSRFQVPSRESVALSVLLSADFASAVLRTAKRFDQLFAGDAVKYEYVLKKDAFFEPTSSGPPSINLRRMKEYWAQFEIGSAHSFDLIHGPLGLWQVDAGKLDEATRKFYEDHER